MDIVSRAEWGARAPRNRTTLDPGAQRGLAVHYSAAAADRQTDHDSCAVRVRAIQAYHMDTKGWADIAYNWLACIHGALFVGRGLGIRSAAQGTNAGNDGWQACCFLGTDLTGRRDITDLTLHAICDARQLVRERYPEAMGTRPHSSFKSTECPGDELRAWIAAGARRPAGSPANSPTEGDLDAMSEQTILDKIQTIYDYLKDGKDDPTHPHNLKQVREELAEVRALVLSQSGGDDGGPSPINVVISDEQLAALADQLAPKVADVLAARLAE